MNKQARQITNPNKAGRPAGSRNKRTVIREALLKIYPKGELGFWSAVAKQASSGDMQAAAMIADRLYPKLKPRGERFTLSGLLTGTLADQARTLVELVAAGELATDQAQDLLALAKTADQLRQLEELNHPSGDSVTRIRIVGPEFTVEDPEE